MATAVLAVLAVGACTTGSPAPAPSTPAPTTAPSSPLPTPTATPSLDAAAAKKKAAVDAATTTLTTFIDRSNAVGQAGYDDASSLSGSLGGDLRSRMKDLYDQRRTSGIRQTGDSKIESVEVAKYEPGAGSGVQGTVVLDACVDNSSMDVVLPDGSSRLDPDYPRRLVVTYTLRDTDGHWTVDDVTSDAERTC